MEPARDGPGRLPPNRQQKGDTLHVSQRPRPLFREANTVLHARSRQHYWHGVGPLSIKAFFAGQAHYAVGEARYVADETNYLVLNDGQLYTISIDAAHPVESLCVFFARGFADHVRRSLSASTKQLMDDPHAAAASGAFFEHTYPRHDGVTSLLLEFRAASAAARDEPGWLEEWYHRLMEQLVATQRDARRKVADLPGARAATREELYRRVHVARDYAAAMYAESVTLEDLAQVAALSPNHLLRAFRAAFHQSPHQYLTALRLERAKLLLRTTDMSVLEICTAVGFTSLGSFSALFSRRVGSPPAAYRQRSCEKSNLDTCSPHILGEDEEAKSALHEA